MAYVQNLGTNSPILTILSAYFTRAAEIGVAQGVIQRRKRIYAFSYIITFSIIPLFYYAEYAIDFKFIIQIILGLVVSQYISSMDIIQNKYPIIANLYSGFSQIIALSVSCILLSYFSMRLNFPLVDRELDQLDKLLKLDWTTYKNFVLSSDIIKFLFINCYRFLDYQIIASAYIAILFLRFKEYQIFIISFASSAVIVCFISAFLPAYAVFHYYGIVEEMSRAIPLEAGYGHISQLDIIRAGQPFDPFSNLFGLISFPSFHACGGVLLAWLFWQIPIIRWVLVPFNIILILATPVVGGHYFVDVIAGVIIGLTVVTITNHVVMKNDSIGFGNKSID